MHPGHKPKRLKDLGVSAVPRVLVVEDSHSVGEILGCALEQEGCEAIVAKTVDDGLLLARSLRPDVIAIDIAHAAELVPAVRADPRTRFIPLIGISAPRADLEPAIGAQLARVFGEPFYPSEVVAAILETLHSATASSSAPPAARL